jgi:pyruvate, water dikinase
MALLIMRVSGAPRGKYFFPQAAGVGPFLQSLPLASGNRSRSRRRPPGLRPRHPRRGPLGRRLHPLGFPQHAAAPAGGLARRATRPLAADGRLDLDARELVSLPVETLVPECADFPRSCFIDESPNGLPWVTFRLLLRDTPVDRGSAVHARGCSPRPINIRWTSSSRSTSCPTAATASTCCNAGPSRSRKTRCMAAVDPANVPGRRILEARGAVIGIGRESQVHDILHVPVHLYAALAERERAIRWPS